MLSHRRCEVRIRSRCLWNRCKVFPAGGATNRTPAVPLAWDASVPVRGRASKGISLRALRVVSGIVFEIAFLQEGGRKRDTLEGVQKPHETLYKKLASATNQVSGRRLYRTCGVRSTRSDGASGLQGD